MSHWNPSSGWEHAQGGHPGDRADSGEDPGEQPWGSRAGSGQSAPRPARPGRSRLARSHQARGHGRRRLLPAVDVAGADLGGPAAKDAVTAADVGGPAATEGLPTAAARASRPARPPDQDRRDHAARHPRPRCRGSRIAVKLRSHAGRVAAAPSQSATTSQPRVSPSQPSPRISPTPARTTARPSPPASPPVGRATVAVAAAAARDPAAASVASFLTSYFTAINAHDYQRFRPCSASRCSRSRPRSSSPRDSGPRPTPAPSSSACQRFRAAATPRSSNSPAISRPPTARTTWRARAGPSRSTSSRWRQLSHRRPAPGLSGFAPALLTRPGTALLTRPGGRPCRRPRAPIRSWTSRPAPVRRARPWPPR